MTEVTFLSTRPRLLVALLIAAWLACVATAFGRLHHARTEFSDRPSTTRELRRADGNYGHTTIDFGGKSTMGGRLVIEFSDRDSPQSELRRADGNYGHTTIDFGGQWMMGRMLVVGKGRELYHRQSQWPVAWAAFPVADESKLRRELSFPSWRRPSKFANEPVMHDAEALLWWFMGKDPERQDDAFNPVVLPVAAMEPWASLTLSASLPNLVDPERIEELNRPAIGGPLYPPIHAMLMAPFAATNDPRSAYAAMQFGTMILTFLAGFFFSRITQRRVWWPVAVVGILGFPGYRSGLDLGQNQILSLTLLLGGWLLLVRGRPTFAGVVWGLLAFKPVWAASFLMVPLLLGHRRMVLSMCATAGVWILASLPLVGVQSWFDWLAVGREASAVYDVNEKWIGLSRDLSGLIRRPLVDQSLPADQRNTTQLKLLCISAYAFVALATIVVLWATRKQVASVGLRAGFLALAAYLCCYHFMYYDAVLALFPIALLTAGSRGVWGSVWSMRRDDGLRLKVYCPGMVAVALFGLYLVENQLMYMALSGTLEFGFLGSDSTNIGGMPIKSPKIAADTTIYTACDTVVLLLLWAALAARLSLRRRDASEKIEG